MQKDTTKQVARELGRRAAEEIEMERFGLSQQTA